DAWNAAGLGEVCASVNRSHLEGDAAEADAKFIQPTRAESVGVVERQALCANQTGSRAEGSSRVAVRQRRRQETVGALEAVSAKEVIVLRKVVVDLGVELIVFAPEYWIKKGVVEDMPVFRGLRRGDVRRRIELPNDSLRRRVESVARNHIAGERLARQRVVNCAVQLGEIAVAQLLGRHGRKKGLAVADPPSLIIAE